MLYVFFFSKITNPVVPVLRFTNQENLFKFVKDLHYFTLTVGYGIINLNF